MIIGIGVDVVDMPRFAGSLVRTPGLAARLFSERELAQPGGKGENAVSQAARFAAKEAFSKAIGLGMRMPMTWRSVQFLNAPSGKPMVVTSGALNEFMQAHGLSAQVSLTDEAEYAVAFVIVEKS